MQTNGKTTLMSILILTIAFTGYAKSTKEGKKDLTSKSIKEARKEAKKYTKQGYYIAAGAPLMDKQFEAAWMLQLQHDDKGYPKYLVETGTSVAETQIAAKMQATEAAKLFIAGSITTQVAALIESNIANSQLSTKDAASITEIVASSKSIIAQELGRTIPMVEIYKNIGDNVEANIRLAYDFTNAKDVAKKVIRKELKQKASELQDQVDKLLEF